jgi:hypothetical protein
MKHLSKIALLGALLAATVSAASAQSIDRARDQGYSTQYQNAPQNEQNKSDVGENGGA